MPINFKKVVLRNLTIFAIWFVVITFLVLIYADETDPMPVSITSRLLIAAGIVGFINIPLVKTIGRIYLNTTPDEDDLDD